MNINFKNKVIKLSGLIRFKDWFYSFVPFTIGLILFWIFLLEIPFSKQIIIAANLFTVSAIGFASLGYIINEYFDIKTDAIAKKRNNLAGLSSIKIIFIFIFALIFTIFPWCFLRFDIYSIILICLEILLFVTYSIPFIRFKNVIVLSNIIDSTYAYVVPILLSYHTFSLYSSLSLNSLYIIGFTFIFFVVGFRNILHHQVMDFPFDIKSNSRTIAIRIGNLKSNKFITRILIFEIIIFSIFLLYTSELYVVLLLFWLYVISLLIIKKRNREFNLPINLNQFYQFYFPQLILIFLSITDIRWSYIFLVFSLLFFSKISTLKIIYRILSLIINYFIFYIFLIFGINLKKEKRSALQYLKGKKSS